MLDQVNAFKSVSYASRILNPIVAFPEALALNLKVKVNDVCPYLSSVTSFNTPDVCVSLLSS